MFRTLAMMLLIASAAPAGAAEATESDTGKSAALHHIVQTRVQIAFALTRASVSGLGMAVREGADARCALSA